MREVTHKSFNVDLRNWTRFLRQNRRTRPVSADSGEDTEMVREEVADPTLADKVLARA